MIVQSSHAAYEAGLHFENHSKISTSVLVIGVKNKVALQKAFDTLKESINLVAFNEPSWDLGFTSFSTEPLSDEKRYLFKKYQLFKHKEGV